MQQTSFQSGLFLLFILGVFLTSCAQRSPQQVTKPLTPEAHQQKLQQFQHWTLRGKFGFKSPDKKQSANFIWQQTPQDFQFKLNSVIGTNLLTLEGTPENVTLEVDDETYQDTNPSLLIWRVTGWQIPVERFSDWVKGKHEINATVKYNQQGFIASLIPHCLTCDGWSILYDQYLLVDSLWLPHKITLINHQTQNQLFIRVNSWN